MLTLPRWINRKTLVVALACCVAQSAWAEEAATPATPPVQFVDVAKDVGLTFRHNVGETVPKLLVESLNGGGGWLDYNNDGRLDAYFVNGARLMPSDEPPLTNALYRQNEDGTFTDVTAEAGVGDTGYGYGCAFGDYDNDGDVDIYVTNYGPNALYRNNGDGTFTAVTDAAGVAGGADDWSTSAALVDLDGDGWLDLYVANYVNFKPDHGIPCSQEGVRTMCTPREFSCQSDIFFRNNGDGTFQDATVTSGLHETIGKGLGVIATDYDSDGDLDLYVSDDLTQNLLFQNKGGGKFEEVSLYSGVGFNEDGSAESGMGLTVGDVDGDADLDMFVTNFQNETNTLYSNLSRSFFIDKTFASGLGTSSLLYLAFGTGFVDVDYDGDLDLFCANGHTEPAIEQVDETAKYAQTNQLWINDGTGKFTDRSAEYGPAFKQAYVSRGAAFGDYDNDGDVDILIVNNNGPVELYRNDGGNTAGHWFGLDVRVGDAHEPPEGARIVTTVGDRRIVREVRVVSSYLAQNDPRVLVGIGEAEKPDSVVIELPGGITQKVENVAMGAYTRVDIAARPAPAPVNTLAEREAPEKS